MNLPLHISAVICTTPLCWDLFRSAMYHQLRAFHVGTSFFALTCLIEILIWSTPSYCFGFFFTFHEIVFLIGLFSIMNHQRNVLHLRNSTIVSVILWSFGLISGLLLFSYQHSKALVLISIIPIALSMSLAAYDYCVFLCEPRHSKSLLPSSNKTTVSPKIIHSDYSTIVFSLTILLALSQIFFILALFLPASMNRFMALFTKTNSHESEGDDHITGPALQFNGIIHVVIISFVNIYPSLMAYREMEVVMLEQKDFYRSLLHEIRTPLNTALMGLQLISEVIYTSLNGNKLTTNNLSPFREESLVSPPPDKQLSVSTELVQEYSRLKTESQVLLFSRMKSAQQSEGSIRSVRDRGPSAASLVSVHSSQEDYHSLRQQEAMQSLQHSPIHKTENKNQFSFEVTTSPETIISAQHCLAEISPYVVDVLGSCETAIEVLNETLLYETLLAGKVSHEFQPCLILDLILDPLTHFRIQAKSQGIQFTLPDMNHFEEDLSINYQQLRVIVDTKKFSKVLRNLVSNAFKFTPANGKISLTIHLTKTSTLPAEWESEERVWKYAQTRSEISRAAVEAGLQLYGYLRISVTDTGIGLSSEDQSRLFQEIIQIQPNKNQGGNGSGLGLYISAEIVRIHNGYYTVTSPGEGFGSTFSVFLPVYFAREHHLSPSSFPHGFQNTVVAEDLEEAGAISLSGVSSRRSTPLVLSDQLPLTLRRGPVIFPLDDDTEHRNLCHSHQHPTILSSAYSKNHDLAVGWRILVVDDAPSNRKIMCRFLKIRGMRVDEADCGDAAIRLYSNTIISSQIATPAIATSPGEDVSATTPYNVIFLDHDMPNMTGPETAKRLRELGYRGHLIGLTGHMDEDHHNRFVTAGVSHVLVKPVSVNILDDLFEALTSINC